LRELVINQEAWELITYNENDEAPIAFVRTVPAV
jgi:UDP-3-O-[3-hydroxymyristoyl] N-acetylglucosamine deacetylase